MWYTSLHLNQTEISTLCMECVALIERKYILVTAPNEQQKGKKTTLSFDFTFRYIDDVLSLNNSKFVDWIYRIELEIKDTSYTARCASNLYLYLEIERDGLLRTKLYDNRDFNFRVMYFPCVCISSIYLSWYDIPELVILIWLSLIENAAESRVTSD